MGRIIAVATYAPPAGDTVLFCVGSNSGFSKDVHRNVWLQEQGRGADFLPGKASWISICKRLNSDDRLKKRLSLAGNDTMFFLQLILVLSLAVWGAVYFRRAPRWVGLFLLLLSGACLGNAFWSMSGGPVPITIERLVWAILIGQTCFALWTRRESIGRLTLPDMVLAGFIFVIACSTFLNDWRYDNHAPAGRLLFFYILPFGVYWIARSIDFTEKDLNGLLLGFSLFGVYLAVTAVAETRGWHWAIFPRYIASETMPEFFGRGRGPFLNPVSCGIFQAFALGCGIALYLRHPEKGRGLLSLFGLVMSIGIVCTLTRSVWLGAFVGCGFLIWSVVTTRTRGLLLATGSLALLISACSLGGTINHFKRDKYVSAAEMSQSASLRPILAVIAMKMAWDRPLFGVGLGQYQVASGPYHFDEHGDLPLQMVLPYVQHNVFLSLLTETGFVGLLSLMLVLVLWTRDAWQMWRSDELSCGCRHFSLLTIVLLLNFVINGMFHDTTITPMVTTLLLFVGGIHNGFVARHLRAVPRVSDSGVGQIASVEQTSKTASHCLL